MSKYQVIIRETTDYSVEVDAPNAKAAEGMAHKMWSNKPREFDIKDSDYETAEVYDESGDEVYDDCWGRVVES